MTREQALGLGLSRHTVDRLVAQSHWRRLAPGLFLVHSGGVTWPSLAWGGVLLGGEGARLGGTAAAYAEGLVDEAPEAVHVFVPHDVIARRRTHWVFVRERPGARSSRTTGSPPRTMAADTVLDLCDGGSPRTVEDLVTRGPASAHHTATAAAGLVRSRPPHLPHAADRAAHRRRRGGGISVGAALPA